MKNGKTKATNVEPDHYASMEDAILGELRAFGAAGVKHEQHRALVKPRVADFDEETYDLTMAELLDRRLLAEGTDGPGTVAIARLVRGANAAERDGHGSAGEEVEHEEQDPQDGERSHDDDADGTVQLDSLPVLAALQACGEKGASVEEIQRELEASGAGRHPLGVIYGVALGLVQAGKARQEGAGEAEARFWLAIADSTTPLERRAKLLQAFIDAYLSHLDCGFDEAITSADLMTVHGGTAADIDALKSAGLIEDEDGGDEADDEQPALTLTDSALEQIKSLGTTALAMLTVTTPETAAASAASAETSLVDGLRDQVARNAKLVADQNSRIRELEGWFTQNNLPIPGTTPAPSRPERQTFKHVYTVKMDQAQKGYIYDEQRRLRTKIKHARAELAEHKKSVDARVEMLERQLAQLDDEADQLYRDIVTEAYREVDLAAGIVIIRAIETDRELGREELRTSDNMPDANAGAAVPAPTMNGVPAETPSPTTSVPENAPEATGGRASAPVDAGAAGAPATPPAPEGKAPVDAEPKNIFEKDLLIALEKEGGPIAKADLAEAVKRHCGKAQGPSGAARLEAAADALAERGIIVQEDDSYRMPGAAARKAAPKSQRERVLGIIRAAPATLEEIARKVGVSSEEVKALLKEIDKTTKLTTSGKARGTKYGLPVGAAPQAHA